MKVGSICECIYDFTPDIAYFARMGIVGIKYPKPSKIYTVREFFTCDNVTYIRVEEIINAVAEPTGIEPAFGIKNFREIEFPDDMETEINEALTRPERTRIVVHEMIGSNIFVTYTTWK